MDKSTSAELIKGPPSISRYHTVVMFEAFHGKGGGALIGPP